MSVGTATMYNDNNFPHLKALKSTHVRSRSFNELLDKFKHQISSECSRFRKRKRSRSDMTGIYDNDDPENNIKRSKTAPPQANSSVTLAAKSTEVASFGLLYFSTAKEVSDNKTTVDEKPVSSLGNIYGSGKITKSEIVLPSISSVLINDIKRTPPTTSLEYFDTYKPNDENWRYGLMDIVNKTTKTSLPKQDKTEPKPVFDSKISRPILPPIKVETERKINFPYESNYTYLNQTYLSDIARYPEYLELAHSLVEFSNPATPSGIHSAPRLHQVIPISTSPISNAAINPLTSPQAFGHRDNFPPLYPYQLQRHPPNQGDVIPRHQPSQQYYTAYQPYSTYITSPSNTAYSYQSNYTPEQPVTPPKKHTKFIPITPPSSKQTTKVKTESVQKSPKSHTPRVCISCGSDQSPCWRPSWSITEGQLCNSCGLRYKKTSVRCLNSECKKIPAKGEWSLMLNKGLQKFDDGDEAYACLDCGYKVELSK